ncbi:MAG: TonB family protein [Candidatus Sulfotelmatobacter sp.]
MPCIRLTRLLCSVAVLGVAVVPLQLHAASELEQHLRNQYKGKTLLLRRFYVGDSLRYDASGQLSGGGISGDWTVDAVVRVDDVKVSSHRLTIQAKRLHIGWVRDVGFSPVPDPAGKAGKDYEEARKLRIEADLSPNEVTADKADALLARIFLTPQDRFPELVPDYWKPCVLAGLTGKDSQKYSGCHFSVDLLAMPGVAYPPEQRPPELADTASPSAPGKLFHAGKGVTMPKPIHTQDPDFSEEARQARYQGTVTLMLIADRTGGVRNIRIVSPRGCGLDRKAVETVATWKFNPGTKDGEPVEVELMVEVDFHLY